MGGGGSGGAGGGGGQGGAMSAPSGVIAIGGRFLGQEVLYAIDSRSGQTFTQEFATVVALAHDGMRDHFYIFQADSLPVPPAGRGKMTVRSFDIDAGQWTVISTIENILMPRSPQDLVVLRNRLAYLTDNTGQTGVELALLDTGYPEGIQISIPESFEVSPTPGATIVGLIGTHHPANDGGFVNIVQTMPQTPNCTLELKQVAIDGEIVTITPGSTSVGPAFDCASQLGFANDPNTHLQLVAFPPLIGQMPAEGTMLRLDPASQLSLDQRSFPVSESPTALKLLPPAVAPCEQLAFIAEAGRNSVVVLPTSGSQSSALSLTHGVDGTIFVPVEQRALAWQMQGEDFALGALGLSGSCDQPVMSQLDDKANWQPPVYLEPRIIAVTQTYPPQCPAECTLGE